MIFITGGVRSGKSTFAEQLAVKKVKDIDGSLHYVATGVASDEEMGKRIERHQKERAGGNWKTWEKSTHIEEIAPFFTKEDVVLLDCVTTLLNNELFTQKEWDSSFLDEIFQRLIKGFEAVQSNCAHLILVSNEVLFDTDHNDIVMQYSCMLGKLHQDLVMKAEEAYLIEAGIPILMKGAK